MKHFIAFCGILFLASPCHAADYLVHVPDQYVEEGIRWQGYYRHRDQSQEITEEKVSYFVDSLVDPGNERVLNMVAFTLSRGKYKTWADLRISISPEGREILVHVPEEIVWEGTDSYSESSGLTRGEYFLNEVVFSPLNTWLLDWMIFAKSWGKIKDWKSSGITVEVKQ